MSDFQDCCLCIQNHSNCFVNRLWCYAIHLFVCSFVFLFVLNKMQVKYKVSFFLFGVPYNPVCLMYENKAFRIVLVTRFIDTVPNNTMCLMVPKIW